MYKVYEINTRLSCYGGVSFVAADNAEEANSFVDNFKKIDTNNYGDSWGYDSVEEGNVIDGLFAQDKGIVYYGIYYRG